MATVVLLVLAAVAGVVAYEFHEHRGSAKHAVAAKPPASYAEYSDTTLGYRLDYPASWTRTKDTSGGLLLQAGGQDAVNVREFTLQHAVDSTNLSAMQAVTNAVLSTPSAHLSVLASQQITVDGLRGMYYLYYFSTSGEQGVHGHYFLFDGNRMFTIVVQALPTADFQRLAPTFDQVVQSFSLIPHTK